MNGLNLDHIERTMLVVASDMARPFVYHDPADGQRHVVSAQSLSSRIGYLPAVINAGEAMWRQATGKGFELDIVRDPDALLGYQLRAIKSGTFSTVMLCSIEALHQVSGPNAILVSELNAIWAAAASQPRFQTDQRPAEHRGPHP